MNQRSARNSRSAVHDLPSCFCCRMTAAARLEWGSGLILLISNLIVWRIDAGYSNLCRDFQGKARPLGRRARLRSWRLVCGAVTWTRVYRMFVVLRYGQRRGMGRCRDGFAIGASLPNIGAAGMTSPAAADFFLPRGRQLLISIPACTATAQHHLFSDDW